MSGEAGNAHFETIQTIRKISFTAIAISYVGLNYFPVLTNKSGDELMRGPHRRVTAAPHQGPAGATVRQPWDTSFAILH